jgi:adenosylcobinamide kinase/adenosylcobinamide-phosphate guanylyltransferase
MNNRIIFITGGTRSGKSLFAINEASKIKEQKAYIATAEALDNEMKARIKKHQEIRGSKWKTYEEPINISAVLSDIKETYRVIVLDCLTIWLSNLMHKSTQVEDNINEFINILASLSRSGSSTRLNSLNDFNGLNLFVVSNEVGMGIVPDNELARKFRDLAGLLNQKVAEKADEVYLVTAGIPMRIK